MLRFKLILFIVAVNLILVSCGVQSDSLSTGAQSFQQETSAQAAGPTRVPDVCPITRPQNLLFTPPAPWPPKAPYGEFWYGTASLWTALQPDGRWWGLPHEALGYTQKVWFWKQGYNGASDPNPNLKVTGRRLDRSAVPLVASDATNGYNPDMGWAMLVGVDIPTLGCWEITGSIEGHDLSFVVSVEP